MSVGELDQAALGEVRPRLTGGASRAARAAAIGKSAGSVMHRIRQQSTLKSQSNKCIEVRNFCRFQCRRHSVTI